MLVSVCTAQLASQCDGRVFRYVGYAAAGGIRLAPSLFLECSDVAAPRRGLVVSSCRHSLAHEMVACRLSDMPIIVIDRSHFGRLWCGVWCVWSVVGAQDPGCPCSVRHVSDNFSADMHAVLVRSQKFIGCAGHDTPTLQTLGTVIYNYLNNCSVAILAQATFGPNAMHRRCRA